MATYSFNIKKQPTTKYGTKLDAALHFEYIDREGAYKNREDLLASGHGNLPDWAPTSYHYWKAASLHERANANVYREITWALPSELPLVINKDLVEEFCRETFGEKFTYSYSIHSKDSSDPEHKNIHVHIMFNERELDPSRTYDDPKYHFARYTTVDGVEVGYKKEEAFSKKAMYYQLRERAADLTNKYYKDFQIDERVDHRSFRDQKKALEEEGRFSEAALLDVPPKKRVPAAQYYAERTLEKSQQETIHTEYDPITEKREINKVHNDISKEIRSMKTELYEQFHDQDTIYAVNLKDYFGELKYQTNEKIKDINEQIKILRSGKISEKAIDTWAKNQIIPGYSKEAKRLKSLIETSTYKQDYETSTAAKKELNILESRIPKDLFDSKKTEIINQNKKIDESIKPLYGSLKALEGKAKKYDRILNSLYKIPDDTFICKTKKNGILLNTNGINNQKEPIKLDKLPVPNANRPTVKSYNTSQFKLKTVSSIANQIDRKVEKMAISNEGGYVATKELTADDIQEMILHGQSL